MWYNLVKNDVSKLDDAIVYFENEINDAKIETKILGTLEKNAQELSGITSHRFGQLQEVEAILKYLNIQYDRLRSKHYRRYLEHYNRDLTDRSIEKYIDGEDDIVMMSEMINEIGLIRNKYLAITKGLDTKQYQIGHIVRLRTAGLENITLNNA